MTLRRTKEDFAKAMRYLVDVLYPAPRVELVNLVMDNLNTHTTDTLIEIFGKSEGGSHSSATDVALYATACLLDQYRRDGVQCHDLAVFGSPHPG